MKNKEGYFTTGERNKIKAVFIKHGIKPDNAETLTNMVMSEKEETHENIDNLIKGLREVNGLLSGMLGIFI